MNEDGQHELENNSKHSPSLSSSSESISPGLGYLLGSIGVIAILLSFAGGMASPFLFDDYDAIINNRSIQTGQLSDILNPPPELPVSGRPLLNLSFAANYYFSQVQPTAYHWTNLIIHMVCAWLLWQILQHSLSIALKKKCPPNLIPWLAMTMALMWAIHPIATEAVLYTTQRSEQLAFLTLLFAIYGLIRYHIGAASKKWLVVSLLSCVAGMWCKELAFMYPLIILLYDRAFWAGSFSNAIKQRKTYYVSMVLVIGASAIWILSQNPRGQSTGLGHGVSMWQYLITQSQIILWYLKICFVPTGMCLAYDWPLATSFSQVWGSFTIVTLLFIGACYAVWRHPKTGFCLASVFLILGPTSSVWPVITEVAADRRIFIPLALMIPLLGVGILHLLGKRREYMIKIVIGIFILISLGLARITIQYAVLYDHPVLFWEKMLTTSRRPSLALDHLGFSYDQVNALASAVQAYQEVLELEPGFAIARLQLGIAYTKLRQYDRDIIELNQIKNIPSLSLDAAYYLGSSYKQKKDYAQAIKYFKKTLEQSPNDADGLLNLAQCYVLTQQFEPARDTLQRLIQEHPDDMAACYKLGYVYSQLNLLDLASQQYRLYLKHDPNNAMVWNSLGVVLARQNRLKQALSCFARSLTLEPENDNAQANLKKARGKLYSSGL